MNKEFLKFFNLILRKVLKSAICENSWRNNMIKLFILLINSTFYRKIHANLKGLLIVDFLKQKQVLEPLNSYFKKNSEIPNYEKIKSICFSHLIFYNFCPFWSAKRSIYRKCDEGDL